MTSPALTTSAPAATAPAASAPARFTPEFFPLPPRGLDQWFGIGRSSYYDLERRGLLTFRRLRKPGNVRGRVLISYAEVSALVNRLSGEVAAK
jgi:hypothetical protein